MYRIDDATAATSLPAPEAAGTEGYFTEGNPATGTPATKVRGSWLNMIQEELRNVVTAGGLTPSKTTYNQVLSAIKRICQNTVVLADTGAVNAYAAVNSPPLVAATWVDGVVQQVKIAHANTGASSYSPDGLEAIPIYGLGLQPLQGGELFVGGIAVLMRTTIAGVNSGNPICVLMECAGGAQQVAPATQSKHAVQMGQLYGGLKGIARFTSSGSWTVPYGVTQGWFSGCAGGGGGGSGGAGSVTGPTDAFAGGGGGGGAGQSIVRVPYALTPGATVTITVGTAGAAGAAVGINNGNTGGAGGNTIISGSGFNGGTAVTLTGGLGGVGGVAATSGNGAGGNGGAGFPNGSYGGDTTQNNASGNGGPGASSPFGGGGASGRGSTTGNIAGSAAFGFGAGGGGGGGIYIPGAGNGGAGGAGAPGLVMIEW
ncbi:hypothetical protein QZM95_20175 [Burkholderia multivorans]|nr:hypothetical protein [Burkholderia multivorans]MDN7884818.1 hypothetical protein [Burkholderia multivorans]MDN7974627.1 hypothetical protein [Burkholderia multivorans]MDN7981231.1 hypothetical protein [Burkholderia multivorans]MDN7986174.1 hypothetical protein [Burkholderia multivorans]